MKSFKQYITENDDEKWMQGAVKRPGALSKKLGIPEDEDIPCSLINKHIATLREKAKGDKTLNEGDARFLHQLQFAKAAKKC